MAAPFMNFFFRDPLVDPLVKLDPLIKLDPLFLLELVLPKIELPLDPLLDPLLPTPMAAAPFFIIFFRDPLLKRPEPLLKLDPSFLLDLVPPKIELPRDLDPPPLLPGEAVTMQATKMTTKIKRTLIRILVLARVSSFSNNSLDYYLMKVILKLSKRFQNCS